MALPSFYRANRGAGAAGEETGTKGGIDQVIAADIKEWATNAAQFYGHSFQPILEFVLSLRACTTSLGLARPLILFLTQAVTSVTIRALFSPPTTRMIVSERGECSFVYRYILRESCSQFDSLPLTSFYRGRRDVPCRARAPHRARGVGRLSRRRARGAHAPGSHLRRARPPRPRARAAEHASVTHEEHSQVSTAARRWRLRTRPVPPRGAAGACRPNIAISFHRDSHASLRERLCGLHHARPQSCGARRSHTKRVGDLVEQLGEMARSERVRKRGEGSSPGSAGGSAAAAGCEDASPPLLNLEHLTVFAGQSAAEERMLIEDLSLAIRRGGHTMVSRST